MNLLRDIACTTLTCMRVRNELTWTENWTCCCFSKKLNLLRDTTACTWYGRTTWHNRLYTWQLNLLSTVFFNIMLPLSYLTLSRLGWPHCLQRLEKHWCNWNGSSRSWPKLRSSWNTSEQSHYLHDSTPTSRHISNLKKKTRLLFPTAARSAWLPFLFYSSIF
jgi:hypothetical protein